MKQSFPLRLSSNALKLIALICMTVDHVGMLLFPNLIVLRAIGRISFPIFAWMIAEGCRHTSGRMRYFLRIFLLGIAMQAFFWFFHRSLYQHILITFSISIALVCSVQKAREKHGIWIALCAVAFSGAAFICIFLVRFLPWKSFAIDYGFAGVLLPVLIYAGRNRTEQLLAAAVGLAAVSLSMNALQWFSMLALPLLALYSGERGVRGLKYLFYIYYPLHLTVLEGIRMLRR